jgi:hypothetical protein
LAFFLRGGFGAKAKADSSIDCFKLAMLVEGKLDKLRMDRPLLGRLLLERLVVGLLALLLALLEWLSLSGCWFSSAGKRDKSRSLLPAALQLRAMLSSNR